MTGLQTLVGTTMTRATAGLLMAFLVIAVAFLAPTVPHAWADPASDADAAITRAWDAGGGATGPLGIKDGGVFPAGEGFGQNFAGGKIYFTPDTGAHIMMGAILDKYLALGGPADGDLGFPNIDEGAGKATDSRNTTFSAADNPVIFFTPDTGAHVVRGAINAAWDKLGGSAGVLGVPTEDEVYRGDVVSQVFTGGQVSWDRKTKAFTSTPPELAGQLAGLAVPGDVTTAINASRRAAGGPMGPLGAEEGAQYSIGADGVGQNFAGGKIFYSPDTGANVVTGQILAKYESVGGPQGDLGFPTSSEGDGGLSPASSIVTFSAPDKPVIFWTPDFGAVIVRGAMNAAWAKLGGATGELGAPTADQTADGDVVTQKFNGGAVSYYTSTNEFSTEPPELASQLAGVEVPAVDAPKAPPPSTDVSSSEGDKWYSWHRWWLLAIVPVAVLLVAILIGVVLNRRRRDHHSGVDPFDDDFDDYGDHDDFESGPLPLASAPPPVKSGPLPEVDEYSPASMWAMPGHRDTPVPAAAEFSGGFRDDQDSIDTAPTLIEPEPEPVVEEHEFDEEEEPASGPASGRHAAIQLDEPEPAQTSLRLATDDPFHAPEGYPIKADTKTGLYWTPGSGPYEHMRAEIWFASEEFALTNGFVKG